MTPAHVVWSRLQLAVGWSVGRGFICYHPRRTASPAPGEPVRSDQMWQFDWPRGRSAATLPPFVSWQLGICSSADVQAMIDEWSSLRWRIQLDSDNDEIHPPRQTARKIGAENVKMAKSTHLLHWDHLFWACSIYIFSYFSNNFLKSLVICYITTLVLTGCIPG